TGPSYTTPATILSDNGSTYRVIVSNAADIIMSNAATLTVNPSTSIGLIMNPGFESGTTPWLFYTSGAGSFTVGHYGYVGINAAKLTLNSGGGNIQLFQTGVALEANTRYRLSFAAYSTAGHDVTVRLFKHGSPY
ncbi:MAG: Carbohydrate binding domain protein, partial [Candidatus Methanoperedens nitroreducens]